MEKCKYIRTTGGCFWELGKDGLYHKPGVDNKVDDDEYTVARSNNLTDLIRVGDLVRFEAGHARTILEKDLVDNGHVSSLLKIKEIYTQYEPGADFILEAVNHNGLWLVK